MAGPAPSQANPRTKGQWRKLPRAGREGAPPPWPLGRSSKAIDELWASLWAKPQAIVWDEMGAERLVARYVRKLLAAEKADAPVSLLAEVRQLEDRLALNPLAMRKAYLAIDDPPAVGAEDGDEDGDDLADVIDLYA